MPARAKGGKKVKGVASWSRHFTNQPKALLFLLLSGVLLAGGLRAEPSPDALRVRRLCRQTIALRNLLNIPGLSLAVIHEGRLVFAGGWGWADREKKIPARADTPFRAASLTKTMGGVLLLRARERGCLSLDDPVETYVSSSPSPGLALWHLASHTSQGEKPGESFAYSGSRYWLLTEVLSKAMGRPFSRLLLEDIIEPLGLQDTIPGDLWEFEEGMPPWSPEELRRFTAVVRRTAVPYAQGDRLHLIPAAEPPKDANAATGLITSARDMAAYALSLLNCGLLTESGVERVRRGAGGRDLPYTVGWFSQNWRGVDILWHHGLLPGVGSALVILVPDRDAAYVALANSDAMVLPFTGALGIGDLRGSPFALDYARIFLWDEDPRRPLPDPRWSLAPSRFYRRPSIAEMRDERAAEDNARAALAQWEDRLDDIARQRGIQRR
jgi:CubicO group peptidase (beta-lactamase class C family)